MTTYKPTRHAVIRSIQRLGFGPKYKDAESKLTTWCNNVIPLAFLNKVEECRWHYHYKNFEIIVSDDNQVITVSYHRGKESGLAKEIGNLITKRIKKESQPLKTELRKLSIKMHEAEIRRLKSYNPKSIQTIVKEIRSLKEDITELENEIKKVESVAFRFGVKLKKEDN